MKKEVKKYPHKQDFNLTILNLLKEGLNPIDISNKLNISMPNLSYYLRKLKNNGNIKKVGYGTWEVKNLSLNTQSKQIRGHAFIWKIKLNKKFDWISLLKNKDYRLVRNLIPRLYIKEHKVWLGEKSIIVYENKSFYASNSINSRKYAVICLFEVLEALERELSINLRPYVFKPKREHYGMIKNDLARQYNRNNEKMIIKDDIEGEWLWIDDSESLGELETKNIVRSKQVQDWWNDNKRYDFKVTPSFLMENINKVTNNQLIFANNIESHIEAIQTLSSSVKMLQEEIINLRSTLNK
jgi:DNA-binding Lrp family transcriptional regulator